jgi:hypothetical protein
VCKPWLMYQFARCEYNRRYDMVGTNKRSYAGADLGSLVCFHALDLTGDLRRRSWLVGNRPFSTNLVSSAAAACFGIPIVLIFLQEVHVKQTRHAESFDQLNRLLKALGRFAVVQNI